MAADNFVVEHDQICAQYYGCLAGLNKSVTNRTELAAYRTTKIRGLMNVGNLESCGAMGNQLLESMLRHPGLVTLAEKAVAARIADWILNKEQRLPDGTFSRPTRGGTLWPDDLYLACPFMVRWAKLSGETQ